MLALVNKTRFATALVPETDVGGVDYAVVIAKGRYVWNDGGGPLRFADEPPEIVYADVFHGLPAASLKYASDLCLRKTGTDVAVVGEAVAPRGRVTTLDACVEVGPLRRTLRVFGDRRWERTSGRWRPTAPLTFERMPLRYERSFGGPSPTASSNPVGVGVVHKDEEPEGKGLPNLEWPEHLIESRSDQPPPAGFGFIARHWTPRSSYAGTYDERWETERMPLLPLDFDERFHQAANPAMIVRPHLDGGEAIRLSYLSTVPYVSFALPRTWVVAQALLAGRSTTAVMTLDTVCIEPDVRQVALTWRAAFPCTRQWMDLDRVTVSSRESPA